MPVVSDFTVISGASPSVSGDGTSKNPYSVPVLNGDSLKLPFNTGGAHFTAGLVSFMIKGLTSGTPNVRITNSQHNFVLGQLSKSSVADQSIWRHEQFIIPSNLLSSESSNANTLHFGVASPNDFYQVRDIVVFFHQQA